jgi:hypothetical protein
MLNHPRQKYSALTESDSPHGERAKMNDTKQSAEELAILEQLNNDYIHSDQFCDVKRFSEFLAEDFIVQLPGVTRNRAEFLDYIAKPRPSRISLCTTSISASSVTLL